MGKNKNKMYESNLLDRAPVDEEVHNESEATAVEPVAEEPKNETPAPEVVEAPKAAEPEAPVVEKKQEPAKKNYGFVEETAPRIFGKVDGSKCARLNVREKASKDSNIVAIANAGSKLRIDKEESTKDFYKVLLETGVSGFVAKEFIIL